MPTASPETVLHDLSELWVSLGGDGHAGSEAGVLRACSMTLVVLTESGEDSAALGETIAALMPEHPARTILVKFTGAGAAPFEARVQSQCWMPFGGRRQICCEQIEITAPDSEMVDVPVFLLPLAAPDLPVILWCRSPRAAMHPAFDELARIAHKIVLDSAQFPDAGEALKLLARAAAAHHAIGDLAWTKLTRWREALSRAFDRPGLLDRLPNIAKVEISYGPSDETSARYLAAWLGSALPQASLVPGSAFGVSLTGDGISITLAQSASRLRITVDGASDCIPLPPAGDYALVREELAILRRDPVFEKALSTAAGITDK